MQLFAVERVTEVESSDHFKQRSRNRQISATKAAETKRARLLTEVGGWEIEIVREPTYQLIRLAIDSYNAHQRERGECGGAASIKSDEGFLDRITVNFIRHRMTEYDARLANLYGKAGKTEARELLRAKILTAISRTYPELYIECARQLGGP